MKKKTANIVPSSSILVTLMMEALHSSERSVHNKSHTVQHPSRWHSSNELTFAGHGGYPRTLAKTLSPKLNFFAIFLQCCSRALKLLHISC
jgi:hypothetical protein